MAHGFCTDDTLDTGALNSWGWVPGEWKLGAYWTHEGSLRFATAPGAAARLEPGGGSAISIREFRQTSTSHPVVEVFKIPFCRGTFSFSPASFHASFVTEREITILDVRDSKILLHTKATNRSSFFEPPGQFSPDGCFVACETQSCGIRVWRNTPTGYIPWGTVRSRFPFDGFSISPTAVSILTWGTGGIQLLHPGNHINTLPMDDDKDDDEDENHLASTGGVYIATARRWGEAIKVLDSLSSLRQQVVDVRGNPTMDIKIVDNTIFVLGKYKFAKLGLGASGAWEFTFDESLAQLDPPELCALSNDGSQIALVRGGLFLYNIESRQTSKCRVPRVLRGAKGIQFSPDGRQLWFWTVAYDRRPGYPFDADGYFVQVETEGGRLANPSVRKVKGWSLFSFLRSLDGYRIGSGGRWVEDSGGRKLLCLPTNWMVRDAGDMRWEGNALVLVDSCHPEPIIIQFQP